MILGVQNFAFLDILGHFGWLQPNALSQWPKILHTACQAPGPSFCKISAYTSNAENDFWPKNPQKRPKKCQKNGFFSHIGQTMCHTIIKFCMPGLDLNMYLHENFHWPVINQFFQNSILNLFEKFCIFHQFHFLIKIGCTLIQALKIYSP